jgi:hypothetical protein
MRLLQGMIELLEVFRAFVGEAGEFPEEHRITPSIRTERARKRFARCYESSASKPQ